MNPLLLILSLLALLITVIVHEVAHGYVADRLGDPTARLAGRLTLNPIPHIDLFGSIIIPLMLFISNVGIIFGWAKPVPIDLFNLKNPRKDSAIIALAGPGANFILAIVLSIIIRLLINVEHNFLATIGVLFFSAIVITPPLIYPGAKLLIVKTLFQPTKLGISGGVVALPAQGKTVVSEARSPNSGVTKKVQLFQSYPQIPSDFFVTRF